MNETEKERILRMVAEGVIRPSEAASLLAALVETPEAAKGKKQEASAKAKEEKAKPKGPLMEVQMQRPDGTHYTVQVPPNLVPMFWQMAKVAIKESARTAAQESWQGLKNVVHNKTEEMKAGVSARLHGKSKTGSVESVPSAPDAQFEARRQILQMIQNGRLSADDASRLIQQLDALAAQEKSAAL